jgi:hypothetical protein
MFIQQSGTGFVANHDQLCTSMALRWVLAFDLVL